MKVSKFTLRDAILIAAAPAMYEMLSLAEQALRDHNPDSATAGMIEALLDRIDDGEVFEDDE